MWQAQVRTETCLICAFIGVNCLTHIDHCEHRAIYCKNATNFRKHRSDIAEAIEHCQYTCGSAIVIPGDFGFQRRLHGNKDGLPIIWVRETLQCHTAVEWALYAAVQSGRTPSLHLDAGVLPCCHCGLEVGEENGKEEWEDEAEKDAKVSAIHPFIPLQLSRPCCSYKGGALDSWMSLLGALVSSASRMAGSQKPRRGRTKSSWPRRSVRRNKLVLRKRPVSNVQSLFVPLSSAVVDALDSAENDWNLTFLSFSAFVFVCLN